MAVKKMHINTTEWMYRLESQDGKLVARASCGTTEKTHTITYHAYDASTGMIMFEYDGKMVHYMIRDDAQRFLVTNMKTGSKGEVRAQRVSLQHNSGTTSSWVHLVKNPLAGRVLKIFVEKGQTVTEGQPLVLIESMKMENEIRSPHAGIIKTIFMNVGDVVQQSHLIIEFEKEGEGNAAAKSPYGQAEI